MSTTADKRYDVLVVGGGPAGLAAATTAAGLGLDVGLVDERPTFGGQIYAFNVRRVVPTIKKLQSWEKKSPDDNARALLQMLRSNAKGLGTTGDVPKDTWVLTGFNEVNDFTLEQIRDHQHLDLALFRPAASYSHQWRTPVGSCVMRRRPSASWK